MNNEKGFIALYRRIRENWIWKNPEYLKAWLDLIMEACFENKKRYYKGSYIDLKRGELMCSIRYLANRWEWSIKRVFIFLKNMETDGMIKRKQYKKRKISIITICNYDIYNPLQEQIRNDKRNGNGTETETERKRKRNKSNNINNGNNKTTKQNTIQSGYKVPDFFKDWDNLYEKQFGTNFTFISPGKDGNNIKPILRKFKREEILKLIDTYFLITDDFIVQSGYSISMFCNKINYLQQMVNGTIKPKSRHPDRFIGAKEGDDLRIPEHGKYDPFWKPKS